MSSITFFAAPDAHAIAMREACNSLSIWDVIGKHTNTTCIGYRPDILAQIVGIFLVSFIAVVVVVKKLSNNKGKI